MRGKTNLKTSVLVAALSLAIVSTTFAGRVVYVDADGPADFNNIQAAIDDSSHGDIIVVNPGIYTGEGNRDIDYNGKAITVRSIDPNDPNIVAATVIDCNGTEYEPHRGFLFNDGEEADSILDGLTITNGCTYTCGAGILCGGSRPTITNCTITGNTAYSDGGGIYCVNYSWPPSPPPIPPVPPLESNLPGPTITNCIFTGNSAYAGGGVCYLGEVSPTLTNCTFTGNSADLGGGLVAAAAILTITNCTFSGNFAEYMGGGMDNEGSSLVLTGCIFSENSAIWGGGMCNWHDSNTTLTECIFNENSADTGSGMYNYHSSNMTLLNCTFTVNSAINGGGMYNEESNLEMTSCMFRGNLAEDTGGIIWNPPMYGFGGGMYNKESNLIVTNCTFSGNQAQGRWARYGDGGGMYNIYSIVRLVNDTFTGNWASGEGGAIWWKYTAVPPPPPPPPFPGGLVNNSIIAANAAISDFNDSNDTNPMINNCIFWDNRDSNGTDESAQISVDLNKTPIIINYSCIQGLAGALGGTGNIDDDPYFVQSGYWDTSWDQPWVWVEGDYHLLLDSPCIDTGDPNYIADPNETDLDGKLRVIGGRIDMGAYEYNPPIPAEARIAPRTINLASKGKWITAFLWLPEGYGVADIDANSILLEDEIGAETIEVYEGRQIAMVRFSREELRAILNIGEVELTITGQLSDGTVFESKDVIIVINKGSRKSAK